ncbi:MAG: 4-hydroxy-tetrahydrodipicolinate reductase [Eubacteriales bacterium]|nr:4-hydroxy-tetrahydrodipicolinate reductase [Eubacteriales bacterium]
MKIIIGGRGRMGQLIKSQAEARGHKVLGMFDSGNLEALSALSETADVVIDFSHAANLPWICAYVKEHGAALVYGTTGLSDAEEETLKKLAEAHPVFYSANFSYGIAVLRKALRLVTPMLSDSFDIEVIETHHNQKKDAPSGTAKMLVQAMDPEGNFSRVFGREGMVGARGREIGIHAVRGGTVAGTHEVEFFGQDETLSFCHIATSRVIFANGAIRAAEFIAEKNSPDSGCAQTGLYDMDDLV